MSKMMKTSSMIVAGILILAGLTAAVVLGATYAPQGAANQRAPVAQGQGGQSYGRSGMMGGYGGMMGGRGMMGYGYPGSLATGNVTGWSIGGMLARCGAYMRSLWGNQTGTQTSNQIIVSRYGFAPQVVTVKVGTTLTWMNYDSLAHTVDSGTAANPTFLFDSSSIAPGASFSHTFNQAGTYPYFCDLHIGMTGVVIIEP